MVDDNDVHRTLGGIEFEAELLLAREHRHQRRELGVVGRHFTSGDHQAHAARGRGDRVVRRGGFQLWTTLCNRENVDRKLARLVTDNEFEAVGKDGLKHGAALFEGHLAQRRRIRPQTLLETTLSSVLWYQWSHYVRSKLAIGIGSWNERRTRSSLGYLYEVIAHVIVREIPASDAMLRQAPV